jgi:endonuclease-3
MERLSRRYGTPRHGNPRDPFFCAIYVMLSAQTTLEQASRALRAIRRRWPTPLALSNAKADELHDAIKSCGFGAQRTPKILALAAAISRCRQPLVALKRLSDDELEAELVALPGIAFKTARVVAAMSSYNRDRFAIDTHTWRIAYRLGWIRRIRLDRKPTLQQANSLEGRIPVGMRRELHACLVALGRDCCGPRTTDCERCALSDACKQGLRRKQLRAHRATDAPEL